MSTTELMLRMCSATVARHLPGLYTLIPCDGYNKLPHTQWLKTLKFVLTVLEAANSTSFPLDQNQGILPPDMLERSLSLFLLILGCLLSASHKSACLSIAFSLMCARSSAPYLKILVRTLGPSLDNLTKSHLI